MGPVVPVIRTEALTKRYRDVLAVDQVRLLVQPGEVYALLGLNGAGKTTLIRMMLGMVRPSDGTTTVLGTTVNPGVTDVWSRVGHLVETPAAYPDLTVRENLELVRRFAQALRPSPGRGGDGPPHVDAVRASACPRSVIGQRPAPRPGEGVHPPAGVVEVRSMLRDLADRDGVTIFLSSHLLSEVTRTAGRIGIIHQGRLIQELNPADLAAQARPRLLLSARDLDAAQRALTAAGHECEHTSGPDLVLTDERAVERPDDIATLLVAVGCPPTRLAVEREDLETYFLRLVGTDRPA